MNFVGIVVSSPPDLEPAEVRRILAATVLRFEAGERSAQTSLASLPIGRRISGGVFLVWEFPAPRPGPAKAVLDPARGGWSALLHDDREQLRAFARQAGFQWDETEPLRGEAPPESRS